VPDIRSSDVRQEALPIFDKILNRFPCHAAARIIKGQILIGMGMHSSLFRIFVLTGAQAAKNKD
jgi:hypothetical protein